MRIVKWHIFNGVVGSDRSGEFEIGDDDTDDMIEELAREAAFNEVDWSYVVEGGDS